MARILVALPLLLAAAGLARAAPPPTLERRCGADSPDAARARARLEQLDQALTRAASDAPAAPLRAQLAALLEAPCFRVAGALEHPLDDTVTTLALQRWWQDGGEAWLASQLDGARDVTFPPTMRATLTLDSAPAHPLARLLCRATDAACGRETAGWVTRAEHAFRDIAVGEARWRGDGYSVNLYQRSQPPTDDDRDPHTATLDAPLWRCAHPVGSRLDFVGWYACVGALRVPVTQLPVGHTRAPTTGWLVIRGRRGHHAFCDQLGAYDLATGAYYASRSCAGLALAPDGSVDGARTDAARTPAVEAGRLLVDNLREAAWMILLAPHIERDRGHDGAATFPLPPGLEAATEAGVGYGGASFGGGWGSSAQTTLSWTWIDGGKVVAEGTLRWPDSDRDAERHAAELLRVAEGGMSPGCPPAPLPRALLAGCGGGGVSRLDTSAASLCRVQAELTTRLAGFTCAAGAGRRPGRGGRPTGR